jgi:hypothetical protein
MVVTASHPSNCKLKRGRGDEKGRKEEYVTKWRQMM